MKSILPLFFFVLLFQSAACQEQNILSENILQNKLRADSGPLIFSVKCGYHTGSNSQEDKGFNDGLIFSGDIGGDVSNGWFIGISYDYWKHDDNNFTFLGVVYPRNITGSGVMLNCTKRNYLKYFNVNFGLGAGFYNITIDNQPGENRRKYFPIKLLTGVDFRISDLVWLSSEISFINLLNFDKSATLFSFKIGPTIALY